MPPKSPKAKKGAQKAAKATKAKPVKVAEPESSEEESDSDDDDSEEEAPAKKAVTQTKKKAPLAKAESSDDDSSEEESEEEEAPKPAAKKATKKAAAKKEESSEEDDDSSEEEEASPVNGKAAKAAPAEEESDDEEDSDDEEESEEETSANGDAEKMDTEEAKSKKKRKIEENDKSESKKQKLDEDAAEEEQATLYIGNVPDDIDSKKIEKFFKKNGGIKIAEVRTFEGKRFCYADLEDASQLDAALALAGTDFKGSELKIEKAKPRGQPKKETQAGGGGGGREANKDDNTMFVKNMSYNTTKEGLEEFFSDAQEVRVPLNEDGSVRGFAFVQFSSEDEVKQCISEKQGSELDGRALYLDYMGKKSSFGGAKQGGGGGSGRGAKAGDTKILFVKNLSYDTTQESLSDAFEGASSARVATDRDSGRSKGFGFIEYSSPSEATAAFEAMKGATVDGRQIFLDYAAEREGGGGRGGFRGGRGGGGRGGGFRGGRGGGGRGGGFRGGRGGGRGGSRGGFADFKGKRKSFDD